MSQPLRKRRGAGRVRLHDVAALAGVSHMTVSRYFNSRDMVGPDLQERIAAAIEKTGYVRNVFAGSLASARGKSIGMVIPHIAGGVYAETVQGVTDTLRSNGYQLLLATSDYSAEEEEAAVRAFLGWSPAAIILTSQRHTRKTGELLASAGVPIVHTWSNKPKANQIAVGFSNVNVGRDCVQYLHGRGYRRIVFVHPTHQHDVGADRRALGYTGMMEELGLTPLEYRPAVKSPLDAGMIAFESLTRGRRPADAIIFANDNLAAGALLHGIHQRIPIPETCAIMGFGDLSISDKLVPSLTTVRPPRYEIGRIAALRILQALGEAGSGTSADELQQLNDLPYEIVEREST
ncbi:LacI family DNA-binding transcriptional regulator [Paraburkholderia sediminicola]|uniref:LacI family DNA-binding transcriptional regulator n=1 Tax=Paraburkholderia sediminicola TaxID=458836 RepID=UPI0038B9D523